jgi:pimeloyl-ACP methyl ester carboxylesterase
MSDLFYTLLSHAWSGLLVAGLIVIPGIVLLAAARRTSRVRLRLAGFSVCALSLAAAVGSLLTMQRDHAAVRDFPPPGRLIDVGGYRMHILAEGDSHGAATLVWIPGGHAAGLAFYGHHREFRSEMRSILVDRPGTGWSDMGPFPRRTGREAEEVATLLDKSGEKGPFILVGHSYGGLLALNFARRYPKRVAALVLLDALQPDMLAYDRYADDDGFRQNQLNDMEQGVLKLFGIRYDPIDALARQNPQIAKLLRRQDEYLGEKRAVLESFDDRAGGEWAAASLSEEFEPTRAARDALQWLVYDGELGRMPVWIVIPTDDVKALAQQAQDDPQKQRALGLFLRMRERYLQVSSEVHLVHTPAGTSHNFPYETPAFVSGVVRDAVRDVGEAAKVRTTPGGTLIKDVTVVSMLNDQLQPHRDVLIRDGRIERITAAASARPPADTLVIEGHGRYLMPGLTEMHGHLPTLDKAEYGRDGLKLFVAHGVTTVRSMLGEPWHLELKTQLARNELLGPRLFIAGPSLNGTSVPTNSQAVSMVRDQAAAGYDFLKLHPGLTREVFDTIVRTAGQEHISFQGHVSEDVGVPHALQVRQRAIDHLDGYLEALADTECRKNIPDSGFFGIAWSRCVDEKKIPALVRRTKQAGTWMIPTEYLLEQWAKASGPEQLAKRPAMKYMPREVVAKWVEVFNHSIEGQPRTPQALQHFVDLRRALLRELHRQQVPIAMGTDAPQLFDVSGDSALAELELYVEIGFTPFEALRSATTLPAEFFSAQDRFGTVREGLSADLLLLRDNPLQNIHAIRELDGVMLRGRWLPRSELERMLTDIATRVHEGDAWQAE